MDPVGGRGQLDILTRDEVLDNVAAAVVEAPRIDLVPRVVVRHRGRADVDIDCGKAGVTGDIVQRARAAADLYPRLRVAEVEEHAATKHIGPKVPVVLRPPLQPPPLHPSCLQYRPFPRR